MANETECQAGQGSQETWCGLPMVTLAPLDLLTLLVETLMLVTLTMSTVRGTVSFRLLVSHGLANVACVCLSLASRFVQAVSTPMFWRSLLVVFELAFGTLKVGFWSLSLLAVNVYLAVSRGPSYAALRMETKVVIGIVIIWVANLALAVASVLVAVFIDGYVIGQRLAPRHAFWWSATDYVITMITPVVVTAVCYIRTSRIERELMTRNVRTTEAMQARTEFALAMGKFSALAAVTFLAGGVACDFARFRLDISRGGLQVAAPVSLLLLALVKYTALVRLYRPFRYASRRLASKLLCCSLSDVHSFPPTQAPVLQTDHRTVVTSHPPVLLVSAVTSPASRECGDAPCCASSERGAAQVLH